jgi:hypothetical protein
VLRRWRPSKIFALPAFALLLPSQACLKLLQKDSWKLASFSPRKKGQNGVKYRKCLGFLKLLKADEIALS